MTRFPGFTLLVLMAGLGACGGSTDLTCDEEQYYQRAELGKRVEAPADLDPLDPRMEMPMPEASPRAPREPGSPCFDRPPTMEL